MNTLNRRPILNKFNSKTCSTKTLKVYKKCQLLQHGAINTTAPEITVPVNLCKVFIITTMLKNNNYHNIKQKQQQHSNLSRLETTSGWFKLQKQHMFNKSFLGHIKIVDSLETGLNAFFPNNLLGSPTILNEYTTQQHQCELQNKINKNYLSYMITNMMHAGCLWDPFKLEKNHARSIIDNYNVLGCIVLIPNQQITLISSHELKQSALVRKQTCLSPCVFSLKLSTKRVVKTLVCRLLLKHVSLLLHTNLKILSTASIV